MHRRYLAALLVLSGFCGLAYELIWVRMLSLSFGSTTLSFSTVIAVFLGGLALGSWLCGRSKRALANPVRTYAWLEIATGVIGLALFPVLLHLPEIFSYIDPGAGAGGLLTRLIVSMLVLLPPTLLMGATLPVACAACIRDDASLGAGTAILYGLNTVGACLGTYGVTFFLFPYVGMSGAILTVVAINLVVGVIVLVCDARRVDVSDTDRSSSASAVPTISSPVEATPSFLAFFSGFAAVTAQVVWSRLFSAYLEGTTYGVGAVLVAILVGIGLGSLAVSRRLTTTERACRAFAATQFVLLFSLLVFWTSLPWLQYQIQTLAAGLSGVILVHAQLALVVAFLIVPSAASGAVLPILVRVVETRAGGVPSALSRLYASNTAGSVSGSLLGGFVLLPMVGTAGTAYLTTITSGLLLAIGAISLLRTSGTRRYLVAAAAVALIALFPEIDPVRSLTTTSRTTSLWTQTTDVARLHQQLEYFEEGQVASVLVTGAGGTRGLSLNGLGQGSYSDAAPHHNVESLLVAQIPSFHVPRADNALVVGLGAGATVDAMLEMGVRSIHVLELEPAVVSAQPSVYGRTPPTDDPRVEVFIDDARHHLLLNRRGEQRFDIIASMPAHPWVAASVFTREFYELARDNLTTHGVFTMWFGRNRIDDEMFQSILKAFAEVFPHHVVYDIEDATALYFVGSISPIAISARRFDEVASQQTVQVTRTPVRQLNFFLARMLTTGLGHPLDLSGPINTDLSMFAEMRGPLVRTSTGSLRHLVPRPGFEPMLIADEQRARVIDELLENMLGTPHGTLPASDAAPRRDIGATAVFERSRPFLSSEAAEYFGARMMFSTQPEVAVSRLREVRGQPYEHRARAFAAAFDSNRERGQEDIAKLISTSRSDVWFHALGGSSEKEAVAAALSSTTTPSADPLAWMIAVAYGGASPEVVERGALMRALAHLLERASGNRIFDICTTAAQRAGLPELLRRCEEDKRAHRRTRAQTLLAEAVRAGQAGRNDAAAAAFERAHELEPLDSATLQLFLKTAVRLGDARRGELAADALRLRGVPEALIAARIEEAKLRPEHAD